MKTDPTTPYPDARCSRRRASIAPSSPVSRPFVLAPLRALRPDTDCG
jgi:hypothetical protein